MTSTKPTTNLMPAVDVLEHFPCRELGPEGADPDLMTHIFCVMARLCASDFPSKPTTEFDAPIK